jgi:hypothetical protein
MDGVARLAPGQRATALARACADLYREPRCRDAMLGSHQPAEMASHIATACAEAYCPRLEAPRPKLCDAGLPAGPSELMSSWRELQRRILELELGAEGLSALRGEP